MSESAEEEQEDVITVQTTDLIYAVHQAYVRGYIDSMVNNERDDPGGFSLLSSDAQVESDDNDPAGLWIDAFYDAIDTASKRADGSTPIPEMAELMDIVESKLTTDSAP